MRSPPALEESPGDAAVKRHGLFSSVQWMACISFNLHAGNGDPRLAGAFANCHFSVTLTAVFAHGRIRRAWLAVVAAMAPNSDSLRPIRESRLYARWRGCGLGYCLPGDKGRDEKQELVLGIAACLRHRETPVGKSPWAGNRRTPTRAAIAVRLARAVRGGRVR